MTQASCSMLAVKGDTLPFLQFTDLSQAAGLRHGISLRHSLSYNDYDLSVSQPNRQQLLSAFCQAVGVSDQGLVLTRQVHSNHVTIIDTVPEEPPESDALCTAIPGLSFLLLGADCPLILIYDPRQRVLGVAHAGWRGTVGLIAQKLVQALEKHYGCRALDFKAGIGPCICGDCFEVGQEVIESALAVFSEHDRCIKPGRTEADGSRHWYLDLAQANQRQLIAAGIEPKHIALNGCCTYEDRRFWSYRRDGQTAGRWGLLAGLVETASR